MTAWTLPNVSPLQLPGVGSAPNHRSVLFVNLLVIGVFDVRCSE